MAPASRRKLARAHALACTHSRLRSASLRPAGRRSRSPSPTRSISRSAPRTRRACPLPMADSASRRTGTRCTPSAAPTTPAARSTPWPSAATDRRMWSGSGRPSRYSTARRHSRNPRASTRASPSGRAAPSSTPTIHRPTSPNGHSVSPAPRTRPCCPASRALPVSPSPPSASTPAPASGVSRSRPAPRRTSSRCR